MAEISRETLQNYIHNPNLMQRLVLNNIAAYNDGENTISDPTNPFAFLLECTCVNASNAVIESNNIIRKKYPSLANSENDLYHHLNDDSLQNIFAVPAEVEMEFRISVVDLRNYGYKPDGANFYQTTIPYHTVITVLGVDFILLNNIVVKLYENGTTHVEQQLNSDNDLAYNDIGTLSSTLSYTSDGTPWVHFITKIKQLSKFSTTVTVTASDGFTKELITSDKYVNSHVTYKSSNTNNLNVAINKSHNDEYIDPYNPTVYIEPYSNQVVYRIPEVYLLEGMVSGTVTINAYTCKGKIYLPINRFMSSDFTVALGETTQDASTATSVNIPIICNSSGIVDGGLDNLSGTNLRELIINNSNLISDLPITDKQIERMGNLQGYSIVKQQDIITNRTYIALKSLPDLKSGSNGEESNLLYAKQDVLFNTLRLKLDEVQNYKDSILINDNQDSFIIKSNSVFKNNNGIIELVSPEELTRLKLMSRTGLIKTLSETKYYYNPFYYIISTDENKVECRVYNLDKPDISNNVILNKNNNVNQTVNIDKYDLQKTSFGYRVSFMVAASSDFSSLPVVNTKMQMKLPLYGSNTQYAYIDSQYDEEAGCYFFDLDIDLLLDSNDMFTLKNGYSELPTKKFTLDLTANIYTLTNSKDVTDTTLFLNSEIHNTSNEQWVVLTKESIKLSFGKRYKYIYTNVYNVYDVRKWKTYQSSIQATYEENIYNIDKDTGSPFICNNETNDSHEIEFDILHHKGDLKYDEDGEPIYLQKEGDQILDEDGNPIVDIIGGVIRYIDVLMLEYEFFIANSVDYINYRDMTLENLDTYLSKDLETMNNKLLENTQLVYKSYKSSNNLEIIVSDSVETVPSSVSPIVTLYMDNVSDISYNLTDLYIKQIGNIINSYFDKSVIKLEDIKTEIKNKIGQNLIGVKISGVDPGDNEVISLKNENNKFILSKVLNTNTNNEYTVRYDIQLNIQTI